MLHDTVKPLKRQEILISQTSAQQTAGEEGGPV